MKYYYFLLPITQVLLKWLEHQYSFQDKTKNSIRENATRLKYAARICSLQKRNQLITSNVSLLETKRVSVKSVYNKRVCRKSF